MLAVALMAAVLLLAGLLPIAGASSGPLASQPLAPGPSASITYAPLKPDAGEQINFTASGSGGTPPYFFNWTFGDGATAFGNPVSHTYASANTYTVTVVMNDSANGTGTDSVNVSVHAALTASFTYSPASPQVGDNVAFTQTVGGGYGGYSYSWNFGDGVTTTGSNPKHTYASAGTYSVWFNVTDSAGHATSSNQLLTVTPPLAADFTFFPSQPAAGQNIYFNATASGGTPGYAFGWNFGDTNTASGQDVVHAYGTAKTYTVTLVVQDIAGHSVTVKHSVTVVAALTVGFTIAPSSPSAGQTVYFNATAGGGVSPYTYSWTFGDGGSATGPSVIHAYAGAGTYTVTVIATDSLGRTASNQKLLLVTGPLTASFTFSPTNPAIGDTVTFSGTASGGTPPYTYAWSFGDGQKGTGASPTHAYAASGTFTVTMNVSDSAGHKVSVQNTLTVTPSLSASFTFAPSMPVVGEIVSFTGSASGGTAPYTYAWDFGDGSTASGSSVSHTYSASGSYPVILTVSDSAGHTAYNSSSVPVSTDLFVSFTYSPSRPNVGDTVTFSATGSGGVSPYAYAWSFGDGTNGTGATVAHAYASATTFQVNVTLSDSAGHTATDVQFVTVGGALTGEISVTPSLPLAYELVNFSANASGGFLPYTYSWTFGDGGSASGQTVTHVYAAPGTYTVTVTVVDSAGHSTVVTKVLDVALILAAGITLSQTFPVVGEIVAFTGEARGGTSPYTFTWSFGDGATATGPVVNHSYAAPQAYSVTLQVNDSAGHFTNVTRSIVVTPALTAVLGFSPPLPQAGENVTYTATPGGGTPTYTYAWTFGDGTNGTGVQIRHAFLLPGNYSVNVTIFDAAGHNATATRTVSVTPRLVGNFTYSPTFPVADQTVTFVANASGGTAPYTFTWSFGDAQNATTAQVDHAYADNGTYSVALTIRDSAGHVLVVRQIMGVGPSIAPTITFSPDRPRMGVVVTFVANASGGAPPYTYSWDFGDGRHGSGAVVNHTYNGLGFATTYTVRLTVCDAANRCVTQTIPVTADNLFLAAMAGEIGLGVIVLFAWYVDRRRRMGPRYVEEEVEEPEEPPAPLDAFDYDDL